MSYQLEKSIWTEDDFEVMGWHDSIIYKIRLSQGLELDIDYIFQWNQPALEGLPFTFWVAPATLVFPQTKDLTFELETATYDPIEIQDIERVIKDNGSLWTIATHQGNIQFYADGFRQFIRQKPSFQFGQTISYSERRGISLEQTTNQENPNLFRDDVVAQRKKDMDDFELAKSRHLKRKELEALNKQRESKEVDTKNYLINKRTISELLDHFDRLLKGTRFESY